MDTNTTAASEDEDDDNNYEEESKESLIAMLKKQNDKLAERDLIIEDLKADLKREKKLNDMLIDQASYIRSLRRQVDITVKGQPPSRDGNKDGDVIDDSMLKSPGLSQPITPGQRPLVIVLNQTTPISMKHHSPLLAALVTLEILVMISVPCMIDAPNLQEFWLICSMLLKTFPTTAQHLSLVTPTFMELKANWIQSVDLPQFVPLVVSAL